MNRAGKRRTTVLATFLLVVTVVAWVLGAWLSTQETNEPVHPIDMVWVLSFLAFPIVGWLISVKLPSNPLGWIYLAFAVLAAAGTASEVMAKSLAQAGNFDAAAILIQGGSWLFNVSLLLVFIPSVLLFPDGRFLGQRWGYVLWGSAALMLLSGVLGMFGTTTVCVEPVWEGGVLIECAMHVDNPLHIPVVESLNTSLGLLVQPLFVLATGLSLISLLVRYRRSSGEVRQQIKWVVFIAAAGIVSLLLVSVARQALGLTALEQLETLLLMFITISLPLAIGVAIFKYRLYDIDRIISRTASYTLVAVALAVVFVVTVTVAQRLLPFESQFGVVVSTLVVAALFNPLRRRVRIAVDRRFNRSKYDAQRVLDEFSVHLREDVDLELMQVALLSAADETMQPSHLSLWIRDRASD